VAFALVREFSAHRFGGSRSAGASVTRCSIGVAASDTLGVWGEQLLSRADAAVYVAKRSGRNRVHMALPSAA